MADDKITFNIQVLKPFKDLFLGKLKEYRELIYFSGRGLGKTKSIVTYLVLEALKSKKNILCLREFEKSQRYSLLSDFRELIATLKLQNKEVSYSLRNEDPLGDIIRVMVTEIIFSNGSRIIFNGISDNTIWSLKSYSNIDLAFYDECHKMTQLTYNVLKPTIRQENSQLIFSFNPQNDTDFIYLKALKALESPNNYTYVKFGSWKDNALFPDVMNRDRLESLQNDTEEVYNWIWEGVPLKDFSKIIDVNKIGFFDTKEYQYTKLFITMDTAYTKNTSSDYSVILLFGVEGNRESNNIHVLRMLRGHWEFGELSTNLIYMYNYALETYKKHVATIIIEEKASGISLIQELKRHTHFNNIQPIRPTTDKFTRLSLVLSKIPNLILPLNKDEPLNSWVDIFLKELGDFRKDMKHKHDDIIDCVVYALDYVYNKKQVKYSDLVKKYKIS